MAGRVEKYGFESPQAAGDYILAQGDYADMTRSQIASSVEEQLSTYGYSQKEIGRAMSGSGRIVGKVVEFQRQNELKRVLDELRASGMQGMSLDDFAIRLEQKLGSQIYADAGKPFMEMLEQRSAGETIANSAIERSVAWAHSFIEQDAVLLERELVTEELAQAYEEASWLRLLFI